MHPTNYFLTFFKLFALAFLLAGLPNQAAAKTQVSLITCGPGTHEVYQAYGHTAIRVFDAEKGIDSVYNYGVFDFRTDGFYLKFIRGKLLYYLDVESFDHFLYNYVLQKRWVREQILDLDERSTETLIKALKENLLEENKYYLYDFTYNNCSTKPRDVIRTALGNGFEYPVLPSSGSESFRQIIDRYMSYNDWLDLGIDLLLGARLDKKMTTEDRMFLPIELMEVFDSAQYQGKPLVIQSQMWFNPPLEEAPYVPGPALFAWILLALVLLWQIFKPKPGISKIPAIIFSLVSGIAGLILIFMWVATDHYMAKGNFNLLWAFPLNLPLAIGLMSSTPGSKTLLLARIARILLVLLLLTVALIPQQLHAAIYPICLLGIWSLSQVTGKM